MGEGFDGFDKEFDGFDKEFDGFDGTFVSFSFVSFNDSFFVSFSFASFDWLVSTSAFPAVFSSTSVSTLQ